MAAWITRQRADGGTSLLIRWRQDGRWQSETFTDVRLPGEFRTAVESTDHRWPEEWTKGEGWPAPTIPECPVPAAPQVAPATFTDVAGSYFAGTSFAPASTHVVRAWSTRVPDDVTPIRKDESETVRWLLGPRKGRKGRYVSLVDNLARRLYAAVQDPNANEYVSGTGTATRGFTATFTPGAKR